MESDQLHTSHSGVFSPLRRNRQDQRGPYRSVNAGRWFSLVCETPLPDPASEKYKQIANPAAIRSACCAVWRESLHKQSLDSRLICNRGGDFNSVFSPGLTKSRIFRSERHREREKRDWLAEKIGFELAVEFPQHAFQACSDSKSRIMAAKSASAGLNNRDKPRGGMAEKVESRRVGLGS